MMKRAHLFLVPSLLFFAACGGSAAPDAGVDAGPVGDAGPPDAADAATTDSGPPDTGIPDLGPEPTFAGLSAPVTVIRDHTGIPHIYGATDQDVLFAQGYEQAKDRLFTMDLMRRRALGREAEVFGMGSFGSDKVVRMANLPYWGLADAARVRMEVPDEYATIVAWTAGVNAYIDEVLAGTAPLPVGFRPSELDYMPEHWSNTDAFAVGRAFLFQNANQLEYDILATVLRDYQSAAYANMALVQPLYPTFIIPPTERPATTSAPLAPLAPTARIAPPGAEAEVARFIEEMRPFHSGGSNNWAVDGRFTANGRPIVCSDPHQPLESPSLFWASHLDSKDMGGTINTVGFSIVGSPGVVLGHTDRVSWAATTTYPDFMDIFDVPFTAGVVHLASGDVPTVLRTETITVKGIGPMMQTFVDVPGQGVLLPVGLAPLPLGTGRTLFRWTGFQPLDDVRVFFGFDRAQNIADVEGAIAHSSIAAFNFVYADATNIGYRVHVLTPDRGGPGTHPASYVLLDGMDPTALWTGANLSDAQLPASHATARGWLVSANNDPFGFTADGRLDDDPWYYGAFGDPGTRSSRIESELTRLAARGAITESDMEALQTDTRSLLADSLVPVLDDAFSHVPTDAALTAYRGRTELAALVAELDGWDHRMDMTASPPVAFEGFAYFLARDILSDDIPLVFGPAMDQESIYVLKWAALAATRAYPNADLVMQEGRDVLVLRALDETAAWLTTRFGGTDPSMYAWSDFHGTNFGGWISALDGGWHPTNGGDGTVNVSSDAFFNGTNPKMRLESGAGPIYRYVTGFAADGVPETMVTIPRGESGDPASPHYADTMDDWIAGHYRPLLFRRAEVDADMESTETLAAGRH